jgi:hypothetical protein
MKREELKMKVRKYFYFEIVTLQSHFNCCALNLGVGNESSAI